MVFSSKMIATSTTENWRKPFFLIWTGQSISLLGSQLVQFALIWWLTEKTGSATMLAFASFFSYLPEVILAPFAGALVDRWNRRRVMIVADGSIALATIAVAVLFWLGWVQIWHVFVVLFLRSLGNLSHWAAMKASTSMMVPEEHLARIAGINQALQGGVNIAGPALGAILLGVMPIFGVLFIDVGTAMLAIIPLLFVIIPQPQGAGVGEAVTVRNVLGDVRQGMRYVLSWRGLCVLLVMAVMCNFFFTPLFSILPILVTGYFKGGVYQLGWIESAWGVGGSSWGIDSGRMGRVQTQNHLRADRVDRDGFGYADGMAGPGASVCAGTGRDGFCWCESSHYQWAFSCHYSKPRGAGDAGAGVYPGCQPGDGGSAAFDAGGRPGGGCVWPAGFIRLWRCRLFIDGFGWLLSSGHAASGG